MTTSRWKITIEYDGTDYAGWQRQDHAPSVQQCIEEAITGFCQQDIRIHAAGRTDAGVHASGQVAHFDLDYRQRSLTGPNLAKAITAHLRPHPISILSAEPVSDDFHARFDATNKLYIYKVLNRPSPPTYDEGLVWHFKRSLDVRAMHDASQILLGHHDFTTFRDSQCQANSPMRTLDRLDLRRDGDMIYLEAEAKSFLHHQIRNLIGTLTLVGENKWTKSDLKSALDAKDRSKGGITAPAAGLYLQRVDYNMK